MEKNQTSHSLHEDKIQGWAGDVDHWIKYFLSKHEDVSSDGQHPCECQVGMAASL